MLIFFTKRATAKEIAKVSEDFHGYVKVVVDVARKMMAAGGARHVDGEQLLLHKGSQQQDLWGGGIDLETEEIDFNSMINIRPADQNPSREVLSAQIRKIMAEVIQSLLL